MELSAKDYWSGLPFPFSGDLPDPGIELTSPALAGRLFTTESPEKPFKGYTAWRKKWQFTPVFLPGESHGQRSLVGCSPWGHKKSDVTERLK